jgi:hypothetical protein
MQPLSAREKRALTLWGGILVTLGAFDAQQRGRSTLSEAHRAVRRRVGAKWWTVLWGSFATWFWWHVKED